MPPRRFRSLARAGLAAAVACGLLVSSARAKASFQWPDFKDLAARYPGVGAVCLLDQREAEMADLGGDDYGKRETVTQVVAILDPTRAEDWLDRTLYSSEYHRVMKITARTWSAPGKFIEVKKDRIFDVASFPDYVLYQDVAGKRFAFPAVAPGTVLELEYNVLAREDYAVEHVFANTIPTLLSRVTLAVPRSWFGDGFNQIVRAVVLSAEPEREMISGPEGEVVRMTWGLQSLPAIPIEDDMPPFAEVSPRLSVVPQPPRGEKSTWDVLGRRYWNLLFSSRLSRGPGILAEAQTLCAGATTDEERLRRIAEFTQREVRYVAIELGIGGYQPHAAEEVLRNRYGDCKDKVCLMLSLLAAVGVNGEPALIKTASAGEVDTALVDLGQFNHAIARVDLGDRAVWVDPTAASCAPGYLPGEDQATYALVVGRARSRLEATPTYRGEDSPASWVLEATLGEDGGLAGTLMFECAGEPAIGYRAAFRRRDATEERRLVEELLTDRLSRARLVEYRVAGLDSLGLPFGLWMRFERDGSALRMEQNLVLLPELTWPSRLERGFTTQERVHPVVFPCQRRYRDVLRITPPAGYRAAGVPEPGWFNERYFAFEFAGRLEADTLVLERVLSNRALVVPARSYADARSELRRLSEMDAGTGVRFRRQP